MSGASAWVLPWLRRYVLIMGLATALAWLVAQSALYAEVSRWLGDTILALSSERVRFEDVVVVDVDEQALSALEPSLGAWPYPRHVYVAALEFLFAAGVRTVVFDILFAERRAGDAELAASLARNAGVWLAARGQDFGVERDAAYAERLRGLGWTVPDAAPRETWRDVALPTARLTADGAAGVGIISVTPDADGVLRSLSLLHDAGGTVLPSIAMAALFAPGERPRVALEGGDLVVDRFRWPMDERGRVRIRIPRNADFVRVVGFDALLAAAGGRPSPELTPGSLRGRTVFIGSSAAVLGDYARLPVHGRTAGLGILALAFASLANDRVLLPPNVLFDLLLALLAAAVPLLYTNRRSCPESAVVIWAGMGMAAALTLHLALYGWSHRVSNVSFALVLGIAVLLVQLALRLQTLRQERRRLRMEKLAADEANELKSRFLAHMTHELRTPLTAIMGYNRLLAEPVVNDAERLERAAVVDRNCNHLLELINNLLDQAKIEAGQMTVEREPTPIRELVDDCARTLAPLAEAKQLALEVRCDSRVPAGLSIDPLRLRQILLNLTGNAIKFTAEGGVGVDVGWHDSTLEIAIRDTGPGMSRAALERIFEAFQQADGSVARSHGGTGLGLTISRNLAQLMGGSIDVQSALGEGTTFRVRLDAPEAELPEGDAGAAEHENSATITARVLLADDTADIRDLVGLHLRRLGLDVATAADGEEAVSRALDLGPELVLLDVEMPKMSGIEAARALREAGFAGVILALTGHSDHAQHERIVAAGCDGVVTKPVTRARLEAAVRSHLAGGARP